MAQRQTNRTVPGFRMIAVPKPRRRKAGNDNAATPLSGLTFREQREKTRRAKDLAWQARFAKMKLLAWRNADAHHWDPLVALLKAAEAEQHANPVT